VFQRLAKIETGWKLFWVFALLYLLFPSARYYWDGVEYAQLAERAGDWRETLHPHHVFYNLLVLWITQFIMVPLGIAHPGLIAQSFLNGIAGAFGVMFLYRTTRYCFLDPLAWQLAAIGGAAYTYWLFSADHAPYIPSVLRLILAFQVMVYALKDPTFEPKKLIMQAVNVFLAVMLHQVAVFFVPIYLYFMWGQTKHTDDPPYWRVLATTLSVGLIGFHYILFGFVSLELDSPDAWMNWITSYGHDSRWWYLTTLPDGMPLGTQLLTYAGAIFKSHLATFVYPDYLYHGLLQMPTGFNVNDLLKKVLALIILWHLTLATLGGFQHLPLFLRLQPTVIGRALVWWVVPFFMFFLFFQPQMAFYKLFYFVPMLLLLGTGIDQGLAIAKWRQKQIRLKPIASHLLVAMLLFNGMAGVLPQHDATKNPWLMEAVELVKLIPPGTVVMLPGGPNFSLMEETFATRTWELVEYLGGPLEGAPHQNAIEVVYCNEAEVDEAKVEASDYLQPEGQVPYQRLWLWTGLEDPGERYGYYRMEDRTFAYKGLDPALSRWDTNLILKPSNVRRDIRGQWILEWTP